MKITYIIRENKIEVEGEAGRSLLDIALINHLNPPYSCMEGHCGTCEAVIEEGSTTEDQEGSRVVRTCQAQPSSEWVIVNYDKSPTK
ncbi:2Fe-2S iron-sulfur cluster binding domain-containing protein [Bdellovibrio bacteriovorus]|uniref:2Fe-2S iron-sulfur cluster binding domain-containing protein n=1 Tax=Bdellovibrio bacteriovorus TaxID=959 RepID=UPI0021D3C786|nr:2Fe-2S iron-sulfur cluster binding domain-containing protein [Bdellovibrio bacteriovorus]UXR64302.1 2Fe-2S iron-sulfur cluster binding domain-containing protein [Bdellovibrio bacteriovorus]